MVTYSHLDAEQFEYSALFARQFFTLRAYGVRVAKRRNTSNQGGGKAECSELGFH
jgi:hypothetical protein